MTEPEVALQQARAAAASMRAEGAYTEDAAAVELAAAEPATMAKLFEYALLDPDLRDVRSTRRFGAPMTALKRGLLRLLGQYHAALLAEQTRFNVNLLLYLQRLEERIEALESERGEAGDESR